MFIFSIRIVFKVLLISFLTAESFGETNHHTINQTETVSVIELSNLNATISSRIGELHPGGSSGYQVDGTGVVVGMWDVGAINNAHEQLIGRVTQEERGFHPNEHTASVAGVIAANGSGNISAKGMAPNVNLLSWHHSNEIEKLAQNHSRVDVSNHSYNKQNSENDPQLYGNYSATAKGLDFIAYSYDHIAVIASGNNQQKNQNEEVTHGFDTINPIASGKNTITVGAIHDRTDHSTSFTLDWMTDYSSWGPTNDGRIKPDLVANGEELLTTGIETNDGYSTYSGTSYSTPVVTGAIACLMQLYKQRFGNENPSVALMKAVLLHTAVDDIDSPGPDYRFGWGLLDARAAADFIVRYSEMEPCIIIDSFQGEPITIPVEYDGDGPIKATLVWVDPVGHSNGVSSESILVNDLDLSLESETKRFYPWTLDPQNPSMPAKQYKANHLDNVEQVFLAQTDGNQFTLTIDGTLQRGSSQQFVLCLDGLKPIEEKPEVLLLNVAGGTTHPHGNLQHFDGSIDIQIYANSHNEIESVTCTVDQEEIEVVQQGENLYVAKWFYRTIFNESTITIEARDSEGSTTTKVIHIHPIPLSRNFGDSIFSSGLLMDIDGGMITDEFNPINSLKKYVFNIETGGRYRIFTESSGFGSAADTQIELHSSALLFSGSEIAFDDDGGNGLYSSINVYLNPGQYFVLCSAFQHSYGFYRIGVESAETEPLTDLVSIAVNGSSVQSPYHIDPGKEHWYRFQTNPGFTPFIQNRGQLHTFTLEFPEPIHGQSSIELYRRINHQRYFIDRWSFNETHRFAVQGTYDIRIVFSEYTGPYSVTLESSYLHPIQEIESESVEIEFVEDRKNESWVVFQPEITGSYIIWFEWIDGQKTYPIFQYYIENEKGDLKDTLSFTEPVRNSVRVNDIFEQGDRVLFYIDSRGGDGRYELRVEYLDFEDMPIRVFREFEPKYYEPGTLLTVRMHIDIIDEELIETEHGSVFSSQGHTVNILENPHESVLYYHEGNEYIGQQLFKSIQTFDDRFFEYFINPTAMDTKPLAFYGEAFITPKFSDENLNSFYSVSIEGEQILQGVQSSIEDWSLY